MMEHIQRIAAFSDNGVGGNPAGVVIGDELPETSRMMEIANEINYFETAFLCPQDDGWRIRYFSPEREVPFCGHATIASGAALGQLAGVGVHKLYLNDGRITILQGEDMGCSSRLEVYLSDTKGEGIEVTGQAHSIEK